MKAFLRSNRFDLVSSVIALLCGLIVVLMRRSLLPLFFTIGGVVFSVSDFFVLLSAGLCGIQNGMVTFLVIFLAEVEAALNSAPSQGSTLFSLLIYLLLILFGGYFSACRRYAKLSGTFRSSVFFVLFLGCAWYVLAYYLLREEVLPYRSTDLFGEFLGAFPEAFASQLLLYLLFRFLPEKAKRYVRMGRYYTSDCEASLRTLPDRQSKTEQLVTFLTLSEAALLSLFAVALSFLQYRTMAQNAIVTIGDQLLLGVQMFLLIMCAAVPLVIGINERLRHRVEEPLTKEFMIALAETVDAKDHYTSGHSRRVAAYSREIARRAGLTAREQSDIYDMALLHDIGKIGVSEAVINKRSNLTDAEYAEIRQHPLIGYEILSHVQDLPRLAIGARWHHERYDGAGYPDGLAGTNIPAEARMICVADAYDAMTSKRTYSGVRPQREVRDEIVAGIGKQFDPEYAQIMAQMIDEDTKYNMREK